MKLGRTLKETRRHRQLTISQLSELTGVSKTYISYIENDVREPDYEIINKICIALDLPIELLMFKNVDLDAVQNPKVKEFYNKLLPFVEKFAKGLN